MNLKLTFLLCFFLGLMGLQAEAQTTDCSIYGDSTVCENESQSYTSGYVGGYQYSWGAFGGAIAGTNTSPSVNVNWGFVGSGQVTVVIKDSANTIICTKIMNVTVNPLPTPEIIPSISPICNFDSSKQGTDDRIHNLCVSACDSTWISYSTTNNVGSTYTWVVTGTTNYTITGNTINVYWENVGLGTLKVIETTAAGCIAEDEICIDVIPRPSASFITIPAASGGIVTICLGQSVFFDNTSSADGGSDLFTYEWIFGDGDGDLLFAPGAGDVSHQYNTSGLHTAMLIVTNECGCKDTASVTVNVNSTPGPDIQCVSTVCPGSPITYSTNAVCITYNWSITNGTILSGTGTSEVTVQWSGVSPAVLTLATPGCAGYCSTPTSLVVPVIPTSPTYDADTLMCQYGCQTIQIDCAIPIDSIIWHLPPGMFAYNPDTINTHTIEICSNGTIGSGTIWVEYFHNTNGSITDLECGGDLYIPINVKPQFYIYGATEFCENQSFNFYSYTPAPTNIFWEIFDASGTLMTSTTALSVSPFTGTWSYGPGVFTVSKTDADDKHCNKTETMVVLVNESPLAPSIVGQDTVCPNSSHMYTGIVADALHTVNWTVTNGTPTSGIGSTNNVTWSATGPYVVIANAQDLKTGCISANDTLNVASYLPLTASVINGPDTVCSNGFANYSTSTYGTNYEWSINPSIAGSVNVGQYSNTIEIQTNNYTGNAWIVLERTLCNLTIKDSVLVYVRPVPSPNIIAPDSICTNDLLTATTTTSAVSYTWNFGDGNTGSGTSVSNTYDDPGAYVITLTVNYGGACPISVSETHNVVVIPAPEINITTGDPIKYCITTPATPISTTMYAAASVGTVGIKWYISPSTLVGTGTSYTSTTVGSYYAVAINADSCSSTSNDIDISYYNCNNGCKPESHSLSFTIDRLGCNTDSFTYSASNVFDLAWDFDDDFNPGSNSATGNNVLHTYTEPGIYKSELCGKVPEAVAGSTDSCLVCVEVADTINYVPDFYPIINCMDYTSSYTVTFDNTTKIFALAPSPTYTWHINGGATASTSTDFTTSLSPGTYNITLKVVGVCEFTQSITIVAPTAASFSAIDSVCVGVPVQFTNTSAPILGLDWQFGDGASSLLTDPVRAYSTAGIYTTTLTITNQYGCLDSSQQSITVLPNTLSGTLVLSGPDEFCFGDSVNITVNITGSYAPYDYLWTTIQNTQTITAKQTGNYGVDIYDSKGCFLKVADTTILVNPIPNATILGENEFCFNNGEYVFVASPNVGHTFSWSFDGGSYSTGSNSFYQSNSVGSHSAIVEVTNTFGCAARDTLNYVVNGLPPLTIATTGTLCQGDNNILVANSTSPILDFYYWSTGLVNDSLVTPIPNIYQATVVDSNGCENSKKVIIHRLPDLCGMMTGCYDICDTVTSLKWYAPIGYASYQWYYNGNPILGATTSVLDVPLHQSGIYTVVIKNTAGCGIESEDIAIEFVDCSYDNCNIHACVILECGKIDAAGNQQYNMAFILNNTVSSGASLSVTSPDGTVTAITPATLVLGLNTVNAVFTDIPPTSGTACFTITIYDQEEKCDTIVCLTLPDCPKDECEVTIKPLQAFTCAGLDSSGNPMYYGCMDILWSGNSGSEVTLVAPTSSFSPSPMFINNGINTVCFTYTDLPSYSPGGITIVAYIYDPVTKETCKKEFVIKTDDCGELCELKVEKLRAQCNKQLADGTWNYLINFDLFNSTGGPANVQILPIAEGTFSSITPNPVTVNWNSMTAVFTDNAVSDAGNTICFRILITNPANGSKCYADVCVELPKCDKVSLPNIDMSQDISVYPNPASEAITISTDGIYGDCQIRLITVDGKLLYTDKLSSLEKSKVIDVSACKAGLYIIEVENEDSGKKRIKLIID
ncbi:MAG: PKD repeat protein [Bacteroidia bacterium]|jgi:PKD repeat protein